MTAAFTRDEIVFRLMEKGVPRSLAEEAASRHASEAERLKALEPPRKKRRPKRPKGLDLQQRKFRLLCSTNGLPLPTCEHQFHPTRKWRFDYAWTEERVALECDGGAWTQGRHTRGKGFIADQDKRNAALALDWKVFHCTPQTLCTQPTIELVRQAILREA